jgi:hypothetical protein
MQNDKPKHSKYISSNGKERYGRIYSYTMNNPQPNNVRIQINRADIPKFLSMLHETQFNLIEAAVESREKQGFPEANEVIKRIMEKK